MLTKKESYKKRMKALLERERKTYLVLYTVLDAPNGNLHPFSLHDEGTRQENKAAAKVSMGLCKHHPNVARIYVIWAPYKNLWSNGFWGKPAYMIDMEEDRKSVV